jgi:hypothetical protein
MFNEVLSYLILTDLPKLGMPKSYRDFLSQAAEFGIIWDVFHGCKRQVLWHVVAPWIWPSQEELERRLAKARYCRSVLTDQNQASTAPRMTFVERRMVLEIDNRSEAARHIVAV